jgi:hypothetical protein
MRNKIQLRNVLRQRLAFATLFTLIVGSGIFLTLFFGNNKKLVAAVNGDIRSISSGNWTNLAIWQKYNGSTWIAATSVPSNGDNTITIQSGHTVTINAALTVDQIVVESGAILDLPTGITLSLRKTTAPDLKVYGIFRNAGTVSITTGTNITYYSGGTYQHNFTTSAGTIPVGVWNSGSTCEIYGYTTNTGIPSGLNQTFSDLKWNCASQTVNVNFGGGLTSFTGNFIVQSTGSAELQMANNNYTLNFTGNVTMNGGTLNYNNASTKTITINQTGDLFVNGGVLNFSSGNSCTGNCNITGNYVQTGGTFNLGQGSSSTTAINISGDFTHNGGTLSTTGTSSVGQVVFNKSGSQTYSASANTVTGNIDYTINSGSTLNLGTSALIGRNFTVANGGEIGIGSPNGITSSGFSGNIQVSGTRTYNAGAYYLYNGSEDQITGNGLPATINKLTISNGNYLTLTNNVAISNILNFVSGKILTGNKEVHVTNTSSTAITGASANSVIVGNLRRTISSNGTFAFPVGSLVNYELMNVTTTGVTGCTSMTASFVNAVTNDTTYPLTAVVSGVDMTEMLDHGYWTLSPNSSLTGGTYAVQLNETGFSNMLSNGTIYSVLVRNNVTSSWQSIGTHNDNTQSVSGGTVIAYRSGLTSFFQYGIALGDFPTLSNPSLISGTAGAVGATYLFQDALRGIDLWTKITSIYNGATLSDIDNAAIGYNESFQPFINFPAGKESYIEWEIRFKKANTSIDTTLKKVSATGVDVDGGTNIREFIVATMPTSYSLDPATDLTMTNDSGRYKALGPTYSIANIDTSYHEIMYQLNYNNVNTLLYRTGAVNTSASTQTRQTSLYFRSFLIGSAVFALPIELLEFKANLQNKKVLLSWSTASETNNDYFTIERSVDGINFKSVLTQRGAGNSTSRKNYEAIDENPIEGQSYYRLKQTDFDGKFTYSEMRAINNKDLSAKEELAINSIAPNPFDSELEIEYTMKSKGNVIITLLSSDGKTVERKKIKADEGSNRYKFDTSHNIKPGTYFVVVDHEGQRITRKIIKN